MARRTRGGEVIRADRRGAASRGREVDDRGGEDGGGLRLGNVVLLSAPNALDKQGRREMLGVGHCPEPGRQTDRAAEFRDGFQPCRHARLVTLKLPHGGRRQQFRVGCRRDDADQKGPLMITLHSIPRNESGSPAKRRAENGILRSGFRFLSTLGISCQTMGEPAEPVSVPVASQHAGSGATVRPCPMRGSSPAYTSACQP